MQNHWSRKLEGGIGREIKEAALDIERLQAEKKLLNEKIEKIERNISIKEFELLQSIEQEWSKEEIRKARTI